MQAQRPELVHRNLALVHVPDSVTTEWQLCVCVCVRAQISVRLCRNEIKLSAKRMISQAILKSSAEKKSTVRSLSYQLVTATLIELYVRAGVFEEKVIKKK